MPGIGLNQGFHPAHSLPWTYTHHRCQNVPMEIPNQEAEFGQAREIMVRLQIQGRGVHDTRVLHALRAVPRHRFVPPSLLREAYDDHPLPIGSGQTISQPYIVAYMAEMLKLRGYERVLEVGSGSGYMAAVLSLLAKDIYAMELEPDLCERAEQLLANLGYDNVHFRCGDGAQGWPEKAPFDAIILSCSAVDVPPALMEQLIVGGRMVLPLGSPGWSQQLIRLTHREDGWHRENDLPVAFVPLR